MLYSLIFLSLTVLAPVLAAPGVQYSFSTPTPTPVPVPATGVAFAPDPTPAPVIPTQATIEELKRRGALVRGVLLDKRQTCSTGSFSCPTAYCCPTGSVCVGNGICYNPS